MKISTLIIDDDADSRLIIRNYIEEYCPGVIITGEGAGVTESLRLIQKLSPDLLLLDISLPDGTAFDLLRQLPEKKFEIIFITAFDKFAIEAFRYSAIDYLLKPIAYKDLGEALKKTEQRMEEKYFAKHWMTLAHNLQYSSSQDKKLAIATGNGYVFTDIKEIMRLESQSNYTHFHLTGGKKLLSSHTLGHYEGLLPGDIFFRIHNSHIVNIDFIDRYSKEGIGGVLIMKDGTHLGVSQRKKEFVYKKLIRSN